MVKKNTIHITENELINFISETVVSLTEQNKWSETFGWIKPKRENFDTKEEYLDALSQHYKTIQRQQSNLEKHFGCLADQSPSAVLNATRASGGGSSQSDMMNRISESLVRTLVYAMNQRSGWGGNETMKKYGRCTHGIFGLEKGQTLYDTLITQKYCSPRYSDSGLDAYAKKYYSQSNMGGGINWYTVLIKEVGTHEMCKVFDQLKGKVNYDWDSVGLKGLVRACSGNPWKCLEYTADAIAIIGLFFGPVGWAVSTVAGLVSAYALYEQEEYGWAIAVGVLEIFGIFKVIKHIKSIRHLKGVSTEAIEQAIKYFDNPTTQNFARLSPDAQKVVKQMRMDKHIINNIVKQVNSSETRKVIQAVTTEKEFIELVKKGTIKQLDDIGWVEFKKLKESLKYSDIVLNKVKDGVKTVVVGGGALTGSYFVLNFLQNKINRAILSGNISDTEDYITEAKLGDKYHYRYDRVLEGRYPYNKKMVGAQYKEYLDDNILVLNRIWFDKERFPELRNNKTSQGDELASTCVGVNVEGGSPNPGGGWRPNLDCLRDYSLSFNPEFDDTNILFEQILKDFSEGTITREEFNTDIERELNIPNADKFDLEFTAEEVWDG